MSLSTRLAKLRGPIIRSAQAEFVLQNRLQHSSSREQMEWLDKGRRAALALTSLVLVLVTGCHLPQTDDSATLIHRAAVETSAVSCEESVLPVRITTDACDAVDVDVESAQTVSIDAGMPGPHRTPQLRLEDDAEEFFSMLADDTRQLFNWNDGVLMGSAIAVAIVVREIWDDDVRRSTDRHPERWGSASRVIGKLGEVQYQVPILLGVYGYSLQTEDQNLHNFSRSLISAYTLTGLGTVAIKGVTNTSRPSDEWNNGDWGFPSFHVASTTTIAAVVGEYYGPEFGIPLYGLAGVIGWSRIDERDHDLSDVVFGAALGYIVGKSVARHHRCHDKPNGRMVPYIHPTEGVPGIAFEQSF